MSDNYDIIIIGAGCVGAFCAFYLTQYENLRVLLLEKESEASMGVTKANSGICHAGVDTELSTLKGRLVHKGNALIQELAKKLNFGFKPYGELLIARNEDELPELAKYQRIAKEKDIEVMLLDREATHAREPNLSDNVCGSLYCPTSASINPYEMTIAAIQTATYNGAEIRTATCVTGIDVNTGADAGAEGRYTIHTENTETHLRETLHCRICINAAGLFADTIAKMACGSIANDIVIRPRRGEEYLLTKDLSGIFNSIIFPLPSKVSKGTLIIPTVDGTLMVGPTAVLQDSKEDLSTTAEGCAAVFAQMKTMTKCRDICPANVISSFTGLRPAAYPDQDFIIRDEGERNPQYIGFIEVAGIQSPGLTSSPAIGIMVTDMALKVLGGVQSHPHKNILENNIHKCCNRNETVQHNEKMESSIVSDTAETISPAPAGTIARTSWTYVPLRKRFANATLDEKREMAKHDVGYTRVICSCELVTEADVENAITEGARTVDGVKVRTRAGMGGCQGGFCSARVIDILSKRLNIPREAITKRGWGTEIAPYVAHSLIDKSIHEAGPKQIPSSSLSALEYVPQPTSIDPKDPIACDLANPNHIYDVVVIGGGPAGLAAAKSAATKLTSLGTVNHDQISKRILLLERTERTGGVLNQCIHAGFGLGRYGCELTGPEYAGRLYDETVAAGVAISTSSYVVDAKYDAEKGVHCISVVIKGVGVVDISTKALISALGCRERTRHGVRIAGTRCSGVMTAGLAQSLVNTTGQLPGKRCVILGSGDIGLIMARRMTLEGAKVLGVYELLPRCSGLERNVAQCLRDFDIPLHLSKTVVFVHGKDKVESVDIAPVDPVTLVPDLQKVENIPCDCLLLSVGLIPQTSLIVKAGAREINPRTRGPLVDSFRRVTVSTQTDKDDSQLLYAAGNCLQVHDLADDAALEGEIAGEAAIAALNGTEFGDDNKPMTPTNSLTKILVEQSNPDLLYVVPACVYASKQSDRISSEQKLSFRVKKPMGHISAKAMLGNVKLGMIEIAEAVPAEAGHIPIDEDLLYEVTDPHSSKYVGNQALRIIFESIRETEPETVGERQELEQDYKKLTTKKLTCIKCPRGCKITIVSSGPDVEDIVSVTGNSCPRGDEYARQEHVEPFRSFSTTMPVEGGMFARVPVKLGKPIPRSKILEINDLIKHLPAIKAPIKRGATLVRNLGKMTDIIACSDVSVVEN